MSELHFPWLEASVLTCLVGALWVVWLRDPFVASRHSLFFNSLALATTVGAWIDYEFMNPLGQPPQEAQDLWNPLTHMLGREILVIDPLSAPLLSLVALLYFLVSLTTLRTKIRRFSFAWTLTSEAIVLATFSASRGSSSSCWWQGLCRLLELKAQARTPVFMSSTCCCLSRCWCSAGYSSDGGDKNHTASIFAVIR